MNEIRTTSSTHLRAAPPTAEVTIRVGTIDDLPFIDSLQKQYSKQLGFFPRAQMEGYLKNGWVLVAESRSAECSVLSVEGNALSPQHSAPSTFLGYVASRDRYQKRDELGAIYQLCVDPSAQRKFVGLRY